MDELDHVIVCQLVGGMLPIIYFGVYHLCYNLLFLILATLGPSAMISDLNPLCFLEFVGVFFEAFKLRGKAPPVFYYQDHNIYECTTRASKNTLSGWKEINPSK